ncbi:molybdopterin-containing oxidoreductase family protein [Thermofilum pendens]|uniref:Molybdopterin oxidoreductase n=1 Tax=Thermofilum pendens (strain DSM 2475 / Hrk 5) TaxID=368408 RepID=A1RZ89_THEPD|nr:molybdopterin-dependent oxidoreductase [Thermofilum pendens]ABL78519.1 molybdopterin oxidoreductase [Thermofilum pendens Hrk 5]
MAELTRRDAIKLGALLAIASSLNLPVKVQRPSREVEASAATARIPVMCSMCAAGCGILLVKEGNGTVYVEPNLEHPQPGLCARAASALQLWNHPLRLKKPLKRVGERGEGKFQEVDWDTALNEIATKLKEIISKYGPESVVFTYHDFYAWHMPLIAFTLGTPNHVQHASCCHNASTYARMLVLGAGGPPTVDPDYERARYVVFVGRVLCAAMGMVQRLQKARESGVKLVFVDPRMGNAAMAEGEWVPILPGTDAAFLLSMIHVILSEKLYDESFLKKYTNATFLIKPDGSPLTEKDLGREGSDYVVYDADAKDFLSYKKSKNPALEWEGDVAGFHVKTAFLLLKERASQYAPEQAEKICGVPADTIRRIAREFANARGVVEDGWWSAKNANDSDAYRAALTLNALVGSIETAGGLYIKLGSKMPPSATATAEKVTTITGGTLPGIRAKRIDTQKYPAVPHVFDAVLDAALEGKPYPVKALFIVGAEPFTRDVNTEKLKKALKAMELVVVIDVVPNDSVDYADYVLPDNIFLEREELTDVKFTPHAAIQLSHKALDPPPGIDARNGFWIMMEILRRTVPERAKAVGYTEEYSSYEKFKEFEALVKRKVLESLSKTWNVPVEDIEKSLEEKGFYVFKHWMPKAGPGTLPTPSGLVEIYSLAALKYNDDPLPKWKRPPYTLPSNPDEFYLVSGRDQFVTAHAVWTKNIIHLVDRRVWMNPNDAKRLGIKDGDLIELEGLDNHYKARARVKVTNRVREGVLFVYSRAGGRFSRLITGEYEVMKEGINPNMFTLSWLEPLNGSTGLNSTVKVRRVGA